MNKKSKKKREPVPGAAERGLETGWRGGMQRVYGRRKKLPLWRLFKKAGRSNIVDCIIGQLMVMLPFTNQESTFGSDA
jgi:hypothetical protein